MSFHVLPVCHPACLSAVFSLYFLAHFTSTDLNGLAYLLFPSTFHYPLKFNIIMPRLMGWR
ncbi:hypothetical protein C8J56DRAFT_1050968 [Mycena floridula]|nr:hypothetical protein C8J56DRAFT_1050968 [Mycena floridula]